MRALLIMCMALGACATKPKTEPAKIEIHSSKQNRLKEALIGAQGQDEQLKILAEFLIEHEHELQVLIIKDMMRED